MEWKKGCRAVVELFLPLTVLVFLFRSRCVLCNQVIMALHGLLAYPALDSPIRRSPSLPLNEAGRNPLHPPFLYVLDRRTTDEQTNQTEEFVKVIPFPSQHLPSQHGEFIHFLYCSNGLNWFLLFWEAVACCCFPELKPGTNLFLWFRFIARLIKS